MATAATHGWQATVRQGAGRTASLATGAALMVAALMVALALGSYRATDPAFSTAAAGPPRNLIGWPGATLADALLTLAGPLVAVLVPLLALTGLRLWRGRAAEGNGRRWRLAALGLVAGATGLALWRMDAAVALPGGWGGAVGYLGASLVEWALGFATPAVPDWLRIGLALALGVAALALWVSAFAIPRPRFAALPARRPGATDDLDEPPAAPVAKTPRLPALPRRSKPKIADRSDAPAPAPAPAKQLDLRDDYTLPSHDLLTEAPPPVGPALDKAGAGEERPAAGIRARRFPGERRDRGGPARPHRHHVRTRPRAGHQGHAGHQPGRRHRAQHERAVGAHRHHPRPHGDRHRTAQPAARGRGAARAGRVRRLRQGRQAADRAWARTSPATLSSPTSPPCPTCWSPAPRDRASRWG